VACCGSSPSTHSPSISTPIPATSNFGVARSPDLDFVAHDI
jgi:hypothetical protein